MFLFFPAGKQGKPYFLNQKIYSYKDVSVFDSKSKEAVQQVVSMLDLICKQYESGEKYTMKPTHCP